MAEVDGLLAGLAAAGPTPEERLQEQHGLRERQAGRGRFGLCRSRVEAVGGDHERGVVVPAEP
jgi:hypothetical protein